MSAVPEEVRRQANIRLLKRTCAPDLTHLVVSATHVVLYEYRQAAWHKSGIEGSLFVVQRPVGYELIILNRHSPDNLQIPLTAQTQLQHQDPYLIFKMKENDTVTTIRGVWFHSADERVLVNNVLQKTIQDMIAAPPVAAPPAVAPEAGAAALATLFAPMSVGNSSPAAAAPAGAANVQQPLDKKSLQLALLSLIQDDRFLDLIHSQYLRVVHARAKKQQQP